MRGAKRQWRLSSTDRSGSGDRRRRNVKHGTIWLSCMVEPRAARHERLLRILKWMARVCRLFNQAMEIKGRRLYLPWAPAFFARYALQAAAVLAREAICRATDRGAACQWYAPCADRSEAKTSFAVSWLLYRSGYGKNPFLYPIMTM